jgi:hypothetical protein
MPRRRCGRSANQQPRGGERHGRHRPPDRLVLSMGWARAAAKQSPHPPRPPRRKDPCMGGSPTLDQASPSWDRDGIGAQPADHPPPGAGLRPAQPRLRHPRRHPQPPRPPSPPRPRSRPLARHPRRRRQQPRERPQPGHVAGRPGLPGRRRHPHRPSRTGPEPTRSRTARPRTLTTTRNTSTKEP